MYICIHVEFRIIILYMRKVIIALLMLVSVSAAAQDFFSTRQLTLQRKSATAGVSWSAEVEYPTDGPVQALRSARLWLAEVLEVDAPLTDGTTLLRVAADSFLVHASGKRTIRVERAYEDENCVTFQSWVTDTDEETWKAADCASFDKRDGHRITISEIFNCSTQQLQQLMWQYHGDMQLDVESADQLVAVNAGFTDGWVVVIGPAHHQTGAEFRMRYMRVLPYLHSTYSGYYGGEDEEDE